MAEDGTGVESAPTETVATEGPRTVQEVITAYRDSDTPWTSTVPQPESHAEVQERDEQGRFVSATPAATEPSTGADEGEVEQESKPETDAAASEAHATEEGDAEDEGETEGKPDDEQEAEAEPFTLKLPGRREGDEEVDLQIDGLDEPTRERLAQMRNGFMRGEEYRDRIAVVESKEHELLSIAEELAEDPGAFLVEKVHPTMQKDAALALMARLMDSEAYDEIVDQINEWEKEPEKRAEFVRQQTESRPPPEVRQNLIEVRNAVAAYVPEGATQEDVQGFQRAAFGILTAYVNAKKLDSLDPAKVPGLIAAVAEEYGFNAPAPKQTADPEPKSPPTPTAPAAAPAADKVEAARTHGTKLVTASARRREATAVSPAGPGAVAQSGTPPPGQSIEDRLKWFRSQK